MGFSRRPLLGRLLGALFVSISRSLGRKGKETLRRKGGEPPRKKEEEEEDEGRKKKYLYGLHKRLGERHKDLQSEKERKGKRSSL